MTSAGHDHDDKAAAIARGDADAFAAWLAFAEPLVRRGLTSFAARVDVEAVVQETLLRVWQVAPRFEPDGRPNGLARLALRIGRNLAVSEIRRLHGVAVDLDDADGAELATDAPSDPLLRQVLAECAEALPDSPKKALRARCESQGGEPDRLLAERLGMRLNTFLQAFTRARRLLAECLSRRGVSLEGELAR